MDMINLYYLLGLSVFAVSALIQNWLRSVYGKWSRVANHAHLTGADVAAAGGTSGRRTAACLAPVEAPAGAMARPITPPARWTSVSTVGRPRESQTRRPFTATISLLTLQVPSSRPRILGPAEWEAKKAGRGRNGGFCPCRFPR